MSGQESENDKYKRVAEEAQHDLGIAFESAAVTHAMASINVNRFQIINTDQEDRKVIVVGGGAVSLDKNDKVGLNVRTAGAYMLSKDFAAEMAVHLIERFAIDEGDLERRREKARKMMAREND